MASDLQTENRQKRLTLGNSLLVCCALFQVWQMGVVFFSGDALSLSGRAPVPDGLRSGVLVILAGYIAATVFLILLQEYCVAAARVVLLISLAAACGRYLTDSATALARLYSLEIFCCSFLIGITGSIVVNLFEKETELRDIRAGSLVCCPVIAILQNELLPFPYESFHALTVVLLVAILYFYVRLPADRWPRYAEKRGPLVAPKDFFVGVYLLIALSSVMLLFGSTVAESVPGGVSVFYLAMGGCGVLCALVWKHCGLHPLRAARYLTVVSAAGFVCVLAAQGIPQLLLPACALLGAGGIACNLSYFYGIVLMERYPSRWIAPSINFIALVSVVLHAALLGALRTNTVLLYSIYAVAAVCAAMVYLIMEPLLIYSFRRRESEIAPETPEGTPPDALAAQEPVLPAGSAVYAELSAQERRIAEYILRGYSAAETAGLMYLSENTVKSYRKALYSKLQIHSRRELFELSEAARRAAR